MPGGREAVGIALIGAGFIADYHLSALAGCERASVRVIVGRNPERCRRLADRYRIAGATADLAATLARGDIDAVLIATPDDTHESIAIAAARAGKAILLQKPMATSVAGCRRIIEAATAAGVDLQVSFMHRWFDEVQHTRALLADGAIGAVTSVRLRNATPGPDWDDWFFDADRVGGGVVHQLGIHGIDLAGMLVGEIVEVSARTATLVPERTLADGRRTSVRNPDSAWSTYVFRDGAMGSHEMSMIEPQGCDRFRLELYGSEGTIWLRSERGRCAVWAPRFLGRSGWWLPALPSAPPGRAQHERWLDGLTGVQAPETTALDAVRGMQVAEAILRSAADGGRAARVEA